MDKSNLAKRFCNLWQACAGANAEQVWQQLQQHYTEPHRHYHTLGHLSHCLGELDSAKDHVVELNATEMAIWFHDIIYHYGARDNEILSAAYLRNVAGPTMQAQFIDRVCEFIIATQHTGAAKDAATVTGIERKLTSHLGARVAVLHTPKKGRIVIEYRGNEDLQRLLEKLGVEA